ncbi:MAG TPA: PepSY domain-containing protein [Nitrososphaeraceae archaeon]|nr:PepSY domain-containing protein [Nitrososphaeraceae archaeon]
MKIVLTTTFLVAVLAIGVFGINNNVFAQGNDTGLLENDQIMSINSTLESNPMNATLAYAQEGFQTEDLVNETIDLGNNTGKMGMDSDSKMNLNATINVETTMAEAFKSKITTDIIGAIQAAQASVGPNSFVCSAELTPAHGYLVYKIMAADENMKIYKVIVDPGNGQVLIKKEVTWDEAMYDKMRYGNEKKYDKYSRGDTDHGYGSYDNKNKMTMKNGKY